MAYAQRVDGKKGTRYRGFYKDADGSYKSVGTYDDEERALSVARAAEKRAAELISGAVGGLDPVTRATRTIVEYKPIFLRHHRVEGNTKDTYSVTLRLHVQPFLGKVRLAETDRTWRAITSRRWRRRADRRTRSGNARWSSRRCSAWQSPTAT